MFEEFLYTVTTVGFNLTLEINSPNFQLSKGFGTPEVNDMTSCNRIQVLCTMFPLTKNEAGETRQGIILFKLELKKPLDAKEVIAPINITTEYDDIIGFKRDDKQTLNLESNEDDFFQDNSIRKAILLVRYTDFMNDFIDNQDVNTIPWAEHFKKFIEYFKKEKEAIGDNNLQQELDILNKVMEVYNTDEKAGKKEEKEKEKEKEKDQDNEDMDVSPSKSAKRKAETPVSSKAKKSKIDKSPSTTTPRQSARLRKH